MGAIGFRVGMTSDEEMSNLIDKIQEYLDAEILAVMLRRADGKVVLACPPVHREEVMQLLKKRYWHEDGS